MSNFDLTGQEIRNTYEQLLQGSGSIEVGVSGSAVVDGTGSRITTLHVTASQATSASFATTALSASYAPGTGVTSIIAGTGISVDQATGNVTVTNTAGALATGSLLVTASNVDAVITYTKGDGSVFTNTINNVANATEAEDLVITVKNISGGTLAKGTAVHAVSVTGENVDVIAASNDSASAMPAIGLLSAELTNNSAGTCIIAGRDIGLDTSGLTAGASVYVHTGGALTSTKPTGSALIQNIGTAAKIDASDGEIIIQGAGRTNDLPNITAGYAWVGDTNGVPQAVATSSFSTTAFPFTGNAQITGSLVVSQSGLSSGEDVFVLGAPRTGGSSLEGVIRSTVDDGMHFYGNKFFNNGSNTFSGGITGFESGPVQFGPAGSPVNLEMQNNSAITASGGTLPIKGDVDVDGQLQVNSSVPTVRVGDSTSPTGTPNVNLYNDYSGSAAKFANITISDTSGTEPLPTLLGRFANATPFGGVGAGSFTVLAGGGSGGEFNHWAFVMDQTSDIKVLKELAMRQGANITGSLDISGAITASNASFTSASIGYLQTVTGSATIIGDEFIVLNADSPTARYAGIKVYDSGSGLTGSFEWDSVDDNWIQVETGGSSAGMLTGASGSKGSETYPSANTILKGTGNHTVVDSSITDDGTNVTMGDVIADKLEMNGSGVGNGNGAITLGTSTNGLQYPQTYLYSDEDTYPNNIFAGYLLKDLGTSGGGAGGNTEATLEISTYNPNAVGEIALGMQFNNSHVWWISPNHDYFNVEKEVKAKAGVQITGSLIVTGSQTLTGSLNINGTTNANGSIVQTSGVINALGGNGGNAITVGSSGYGLQYPSMNIFTDSASYAASGGVYAAHRLEDRGTGDFGTFALSTFNADDPGNLALEVQYNNDIVWWISEGQDRFHVNKEIKAVSGLQATGSVNITGSLAIDGQVTGAVTSLAIASTTASMDFNDGNFFNLTLANGVDTHLDATNVAAGQTITLTVTNNATAAGTLSFSPDFKFADGTAPTVTAAVDAVDILTFVTTDATSVYGTGLLNFS